MAPTQLGELADPPETRGTCRNLRDGHKLDAPITEATEGDRISPKLQQVPGAGA